MGRAILAIVVLVYLVVSWWAIWGEVFHYREAGQECWTRCDFDDYRVSLTRREGGSRECFCSVDGR